MVSCHVVMSQYVLFLLMFFMMHSFVNHEHSLPFLSPSISSLNFHLRLWFGLKRHPFLGFYAHSWQERLHLSAMCF